MDWAKLVYKADARHARIIMEGMGLTSDSKAVTSQCDKSDPGKDDDEDLVGEVKQFRRLAASANYLGQDRHDIQYAVKEVRREMSTPTWGRGGMRKLKRLARYLLMIPEVEIEFEDEDHIWVDVFSDSD